MNLNPKSFAQWLIARAEAHDGYIMCAVGQNPKSLGEWYYSGQYSGKQLEYANHWREAAARVFDCQGLADCYTTENAGMGKINVRARDNYADWCGIRGEGVIPAQRRTEGAAVFRMGASYIEHVGFLVEPVNAGNRSGDWWVVEARGVKEGVVKTRLLERNWNRWGWMTKYFAYSEQPASANYGTRTLKRGMVGADVQALQRDLIALGYSCGAYGMDGEFGQATESAVKAFQRDNNLTVDGMAGAKTFDAIEVRMPENGGMIERAEPEKTVAIAGGTWNIRTAPGTAGSRVLGYAKTGEKYAPGAAEADGWISIIYNDEMAWISEKGVKK